MTTTLAPNREAVVTTTMHRGIAETLAELATLPSPVVRSGHVGNNTSNIWGWLALAGNAQLAQVDHNLYGVDEVCLPWMVLGDGGQIDAAYDLEGQPVPELVGEHATAARARVPRKHYAHLALGLAADHPTESGPRDLMAHHFEMAERLAQRMNGSRATCDALDLVAERPRLTELARDLHRVGRLDRLFDRYILPTRRGHLTQLKLGPIEDLGGGDLRLAARDGREVFRGSLDALLEEFFGALEAIARRLTSGVREPHRRHPWITSAFGYFAIVLAELAVAPGRTEFWHGGGSTSQYYVHDPETRRQYRELRDLLVDLAHLPAAFRLRIVPTYCCQLFATNATSLAKLETLVDAWHETLATHRAAADRTVDTLADTTDPLPPVRRFVAELGLGRCRDLARWLHDFNTNDPNVLPVAHAAGHDLPTYNTYGIAQTRLFELTPRFPAGFAELTWGEAELLVKVLAEIDLDRLG